MEMVQIGASGRSTTRLGFGCSSVLGSQGRTQSLGMLESVLDHGIRHFDIAPLHGYALTANPHASRRSAEAIGADIPSSSVLAQLIVKAALIFNPASIRLFSSKTPHPTAANAGIPASTPHVVSPINEKSALRFASEAGGA